MWILQLMDKDSPEGDNYDSFVGPFESYNQAIEYVNLHKIRGFFVRFVTLPV